MATGYSLLKNAVLFDTETTGVGREIGVHEMAVYDMDSRELYEYILKPRLTRAAFRNEEQDAAKMASTSMDLHEFVKNTRTWQDVITAQVEMKAGKQDNWESVKKVLKYTNRFLYDMLENGRYPHLMGTETPQQLRARQQRFSRLGIQAHLSQRAGIEEVLRPGSALLQKLRGKTVWIANANFECLGEGTLVEAPDGQMLPIEEIGDTCEVWGTSPKDAAYRERIKVQAKPAVSKGHRQSFSVKPTYGIPTVASARHKWFTQRGWIETKDLTTDDWLLLDLGKQPAKPRTDRFTAEELSLIGWFIAEGRRIPPVGGSCLNVTVDEREYQEALPLPYPDQEWRTTNGKDWRLVGAKGRKNPALELLRRLNLDNKYSFEKEIPQEVLQCNTRELIPLIQAMYAGDGHVSVSGLVYTTTSRRLAEQLSMLLRRYGLWSKWVEVEDNRKPHYKTVYRIELSAEVAWKFRYEIGLTGRKARELRDMLTHWEQRTQYRSTRRVPIELTPDWKAEWKSYCDQQVQYRPRGRFPYKKLLKEFCGCNTDGVYDGNAKSWSEYAARKLDVVLGWKLFSSCPWEEFMWTPISSVSAVGVVEVWDIETNTGEYLANGLVVHNSKVLGAQIQAMAAQQMDAGLMAMMETQNPSTTDPMYVTGVEVNKARAFAQQTGDYTQVWKAYLANPPKAGETAVRDIQDVVRAFMSYGKQLGMLNTKDQYFGTAMDTVYKLFSSVEGTGAATQAHRAAEDVGIFEKYVLENAVKYTTAMQEVAEGTDRGMELLALAQKGEGEFAGAGRYFARLQHIAGTLQEENLVKRMVRAQTDLMDDGISYQIAGHKGTYQMDQVTPSGKQVKVDRTSLHRKGFRSLDAVASFVDSLDSYSDTQISARQVAQQMREHLAQSSLEPARALQEFEYTRTTTEIEGRRVRLSEAIFEQEADTIAKLEHQEMSRLVTRARYGGTAKALIDNIPKIPTGKVAAGAIALGTAVSMAGALWSMADGNPQPAREQSIVTYDFHEWKRRQEDFYALKNQDSNPGMQKDGLSAMRRSSFTDFGSPYRGMLGSHNVLIDQELIRERQKWVTEKYGAQHYDPVNGLFGADSPFGMLNKFGRRGYSYLHGGNPIDAQNYNGLRGSGYLAINLSDGSWKMSLEDVDTIVVQRGGVRGAITSFFGMNKRYKFRLAGLDSTEVTHGFFKVDGHGYHQAQPMGEQATEAMRQMLENRNISLVYDPSQTTYGRMLGVLYSDGQNLNTEAVRRGYAAFLPFGNPADSMVRWDQLRIAEQGAVAAKRGLWSQPWAQAFYDFSAASGRRLTFNTLARKESIVQNTGRMSLISLMEQAQAQGFYSTADRIRATQLGRQYRDGSDNVSPTLFEISNAPANNYMDEMLRDQADFMKTKGTGRLQEKFSSRGSYGQLDAYMALDTMESSTSVWNRRNLRAFEQYNSGNELKARRRAMMAAEQRRVNHEFGMSHVNHHRM